MSEIQRSPNKNLEVHMIVRRLVRGMQFIVGCALLFSGVYLVWQKRAEVRPVRSDREFGASAYVERLEATQALGIRNTLDPAEHARERKSSPKRAAKKVESRVRHSRHESVGRV